MTQLIRADFPSREALRDALLETVTEGGLVLAGRYEVTAGSPVVIRITAPDLEPGVFLEGILQSRPSASMAETTVRFRADQRERFAFVRRWSQVPTGATAQRGEWRFPSDAKVFVSPEKRATRSVLHTQLRDVSLHGAGIALPSRLLGDARVTMEFHLEGAMRSAPGRVVWSTDDRAGIAILHQRSESTVWWQRLVQLAERALLEAPRVQG